jgi:hypothetical protein
MIAVMLLLVAALGIHAYAIVVVNDRKAIDNQNNTQAIVDAVADLTRAFGGGE